MGSRRAPSSALSAPESSSKIQLCLSNPGVSGCAASRGSSTENSNGKNRSRRFSGIKLSHEIPSVSRVHRQDVGSQNHPGFPGFCRIIAFFMDYWDKIEKQSKKTTKRLQSFEILTCQIPEEPEFRLGDAQNQEKGRSWMSCGCSHPACLRNCVSAGNSQLSWDPGC